MLTLAKVTGSEAAANYYECVDDYYNENRQTFSEWWGRGAIKLGLNGPINGDEFQRLLSGTICSGIEMHRGGEDSRRAATDLTLSAPKSISMQALIGGDTRLFEAHDRAVARTLTYFEDHLAAYRITDQGETKTEFSGNVIVARFRHDLSRDLDPQLHTHSVAINATLRPDGQWRAIDAAPLYRQQMLLGALYRNELAKEVRALGYQLRKTHEDGRFELSHINNTQVQAFSNRSRAIISYVEHIGDSWEKMSIRDRKWATLNTRKRKVIVQRSELEQKWREKSRALSIDYSLPEMPTDFKQIKQDHTLEAELAISFAIEHLFERESVVRRSAILRIALGQVQSEFSITDLELALSAAIGNGILIVDGDRCTTAIAREMELNILEIEQRGRNTMPPIAILNWISGTECNHLNQEQKDAVRLIVTSRDRVVGVQGYAGTGKTRMLSHARDIAHVHGWRCQGLAPSAAASNELAQSGITSETIAAFMARDGSGLNSRSLVFLDEAGMVSASDMMKVLTYVERACARILLVGDAHQLKAVRAGMPFLQLQDNGMETATLKVFQRQHNEILRQAVNHAAQGEISESLTLLKQSIIEIDHSVQRYERIATDYVSLCKTDRENTLIVSGSNASREFINAIVRRMLGLTGTGIVVQTLQARGLTDAQIRSSLSYQVGDKIKMQKSYPSIGILRGETSEVISTNHGKVMLKRDDGIHVTWRPALMPHAVSFIPLSREFSIGDKVRVTANDYPRQLINGEIATVVAFDRERHQISLEKECGTLVTLDVAKPIHLDHGYCTTVHSAQGRTCDVILIDADTKSVMANESLYYVSISRARSSARIYTDDQFLLPSAMGRHNEKSLALDIQELTIKPDNTVNIKQCNQQKRSSRAHSQQLSNEL